MKKIMFVGRSECGKTTLTQALRGGTIAYHKTQYVNHHSVVIDTPGEYAQTANLGRALALYSYEADVVGLLLSTTEPYSLYPPCVAACANRPVIGIVTQIDQEHGDLQRAHHWLEMAGADPFQLLEAIGKKRGMLLPGGAVNTERAAITVVDEFRGGLWGRITLEPCPAGKGE